jgi:hypothetical protein
MTEGTSPLSPNRNLRAGHAGAPLASGSPIAPRAGHADRLAWLALACAVVFVAAVAHWLTPDARGIGTHEQLGIPPCGFLALTGLPCPACGLTTCFAHMAQGHFVLAAHTHPVGVSMFVCMCACLPLAVWGVVRALPFIDTLVRLRIKPVCIVLACALLAQWMLRALGVLLS